jgi:hypothetical protein
MNNQNTNHTPGPWYTDADGYTFGPDEYRVCNPYMQSRSREVNEANARLINAAPDLLAVCEFMLEDLNSNLDYEARLIVQAAIDKAKGRVEIPVLQPITIQVRKLNLEPVMLRKQAD